MGDSVGGVISNWGRVKGDFNFNFFFWGGGVIFHVFHLESLLAV